MESFEDAVKETETGCGLDPTLGSKIKARHEGLLFNRSRRPRSKSLSIRLEGKTCGVHLTRDRYYCSPPIQKLDSLVDDSGHCFVDNFEVGHLDYGKIVFERKFDVSGTNLDEIVVFSLKEVVLFPGQSSEIDGQKLSTTNLTLGKLINQPVLVTLFRVWPQTQGASQFIRDLDEITAMNYQVLLEKACLKNGVEFISYNPVNGQWKFRIREKSYAHVELSNEDAEID